MPLTTSETFRTTRAWIALGANLGDREAALRAGLAWLDARPGIAVVRVSRLIETAPVGCAPGQPTYLNGAAELATALEPRELLAELLEAERNLGRVRTPGGRNEARTADFDLLLYGNDGETVLRDAMLVLPHPRLHERLFVLAPLAEVAGNIRHPLLGKTVVELLREAGARSTTG